MNISDVLSQITNVTPETQISVSEMLKSLQLPLTPAGLIGLFLNAIEMRPLQQRSIVQLLSTLSLPIDSLCNEFLLLFHSSTLVHMLDFHLIDPSHIVTRAKQLFSAIKEIGNEECRAEENAFLNFIMYFLPEIQSADPEFFAQMLEAVGGIDDLDEQSQDNWRVLKEHRQICFAGEIEQAIMNDDIDQLKQIVNSDPTFDFNQEVEMIGFDCNPRFNNFLVSLLSYSAACNAIKCFKYILSQNVDLTSETQTGWTALHFAITVGNTEMIKLLEQKKLTFNGTAVPAALFHMNQTLDWLLSNKGEEVMDLLDGESPINAAASVSNAKAIELLVKHGDNFNEADDSGRQALSCCTGKKGPLVAAEYLITNKANVNAEDDVLSTALHYAAAEADVAFVELLIKNNADVKHARKDGLTPLHLAMASGDAQIVKLLVEAGADQKARDNQGKVPLSYIPKGNTTILAYLKTVTQ